MASFLADGGGQSQAGGEEPGAGQPVAAEEEAVGDGGVRGQRQVLEGAGDPEVRDGVRRESGELGVAEPDMPGGGAVDAGQDIEAGGLAGSVGS
ncbi:hypothetical protein SBADM41S_08711 [Streptomyces badius]